MTLTLNGSFYEFICRMARQEAISLNYYKKNKNGVN